VTLVGYELEKDQLNRAFDMAKLLLGKKKVLEEIDMRLKSLLF
jgi:2-isopropylmalate synthase